jgi:two-component system sensor histidine kinase DegS
LSFVLELARLYRRLRAAASKDEREFLNMELHDGALYGLEIATVACGVVREELRSRLYDKASDTLRMLEGGIVHASEEIADLRTSLQMPSIETTGLVAALRKEHGLVRSPVIDLNFPDQDPPVSLDTKHAIRKVMQTAVRNIVEHAGATHAEVTLSHDGTHVHFRVSDNGMGFDQGALRLRNDRHGLVDIYKRIAWLKGRVEIDTAPGCGTTISASIPIRMER